MSLNQFAALVRRILAWLFWPASALVIWGELRSHAENLETHVWDKLLHFAAYFGLAVIATVALRASRMMLWVLVGLVVLGGMLEVIQGMVGRDADIHDEIANALGVLVGGLLGWGIVALHAKLVARRPRD
jgi:VanZ family protein